MKKFLITTVAAAISLPCAIAQSGTSNAGSAENVVKPVRVQQFGPCERIRSGPDE